MSIKKSNITIKFGLKVRLERLKKKLTQEKLAELAELNTNSVSTIERGITSPTIETIYALANALDTSVGELIDVDKISL